MKLHTAAVNLEKAVRRWQADYFKHASANIEEWPLEREEEDWIEDFLTFLGGEE